MSKSLNYLMLFFISTFCLTFVSCGDENDEPEIPASTIVNGVDLSLLPGHYEFGGNIAPHFTLYTDGSCETYSTGTSTSDDNGEWSYDKENKILVLRMDSGSNHTYTVKSLSENSITAEWSSVKYGNFTSSWVRTALPKIDSSLLPGKYIHYLSKNSTSYYELWLYQDGKAIYYYVGPYNIGNERVDGTWKYDETRMQFKFITNGKIKYSWRILSITPTELEFTSRFGQKFSERLCQNRRSLFS